VDHQQQDQQETYQLGLLRRVPELPLPGVDADAVDASGEAYVLFGTPDSALGLHQGEGGHGGQVERSRAPTPPQSGGVVPAQIVTHLLGRLGRGAPDSRVCGTY